MARPKEFKREDVLQHAISVFAEQGFGATSTETLLSAMGISRQSMYDTFGDKWRLYLECLQHYVADSIGQQIRVLNSGISPLKGIEALFNYAVRAAMADPTPKCLGVSAVCEFGRSSPEVTLVNEAASLTLISALEKRIVEARAEKEIPEDINCSEAAQFIAATLSGIKIAARAGAPTKKLRGIARMALRSLQ